MSSEVVQRLVLAMPALLLSLSVHEFAHAWVATRLGDETPRRQGRLTLSPMSHIDPFGTLLFPALLTLLHAPVFGWARPVQFQPVNFTRRLTLWQGTALTAIAGPLSNVILALLSAFGLRLALQFGAAPNGFAMHFAEVMFRLNVLLAVFNAFPLPPLDGGHVIPTRMHGVREFLHRYSFLLFLALFLVPVPGVGGTLGFFLIQPVMALLERALLFLAGLT